MLKVSHQKATQKYKQIKSLLKSHQTTFQKTSCLIQHLISLCKIESYNIGTTKTERIIDSEQMAIAHELRVISPNFIEMKPKMIPIAPNTYGK